MQNFAYMVQPGLAGQWARLQPNRHWSSGPACPCPISVRLSSCSAISATIRSFADTGDCTSRPLALNVSRKSLQFPTWKIWNSILHSVSFSFSISVFLVKIPIGCVRAVVQSAACRNKRVGSKSTPPKTSFAQKESTSISAVSSTDKIDSNNMTSWGSFQNSAHDSTLRARFLDSDPNTKILIWQ